MSQLTDFFGDAEWVQPDWWEHRKPEKTTEVRVSRRLPSGIVQSTVIHTHHAPEEIRRRIESAVKVWTSDLNAEGDVTPWLCRIEFGDQVIEHDISPAAIAVALAVA